MHQTRIFQQPFTPQPFCSGHYIPYITCFFPQPEKPKSRAPSFFEKLATLLFTGLLLLGPSTAKLTHFITQNTSSQAPAPDTNIPAAFYTKAFLQWPLHPYITCFFPQPETPKSKPLLFSKNWQLYFSLVYLFWASLQRNLLTSKPKTRHPKHLHQTRIFQQPFTPKPFCNGHYIPYITCFFPQPEKPKSRAPSFLEKLATLIFTGLPLLGLSAAKLFHFMTQNTSSQELAPDKNIPAAFYTKAFLQRPLHPYITCFFPQPEKPKSRAPSFLEKLATLLFTGLLLLDPSTAKLTHFITQNTSSQAVAPDKTIPAALYTKAFLQRPLHPLHYLFLPTARKAQK